MGCCIALAFLISLGRRAWFAAFPGRRPEVVMFAPPARRPAPGEAWVRAGAASPAASARRTAVPGLVLLGAGVAWCGAGVLNALFRHASSCPCACCGDAHPSLLTHVVAHAAGLLAMAAGAALLAARHGATLRTARPAAA